MSENNITATKEIADNDYYYLRSCIRQNFFPGAENIFLDILKTNSVKILLTMQTIPPAPE
ncbi:MAG: hypothetical protein ACP5DZ_09005 [Bacteroidales bacterium]